MLAGISLLYFCFAMVHFSTSALASIMITDLDLSLSEMGTIMGAWPMVYIILSIPVGLVLDRFGTRYLLLFGIAVMALSAYLRVSAESHGEMFFAVLIFGLGAPFISIGMPTLIREWFTYNQRGLAIGICAVMIAVGSVSGLTVTHELLSILDGSWRNVLKIYAIVCAVTACVWALIINHPICKSNSKNQSNNEESIGEICVGSLKLLNEPSIRIMLLLSIGAFFYMHTTINWLPKLVSQFEAGMTLAASASWASLPVVVGILSSVLVHRFTSNNREIQVLTFLFVISCISSLLFTMGPTTIVLLITLVMVGIVRGALPVVSLMLMMHMPGIGQKNTGVAIGMLFGFGQIGGVTGPVIFGYLAELSGGFYVPLYFTASVCVLLSILSLKIGGAKNIAS
jgi:cyanate permease